MGLPDDIADYLLSQGLVDFELGDGTSADTDRWGIGVWVMPAAPDRCVIVSEYAGNGPAIKVDLDYPGLQVRVRGAAFDSIIAADKIRTLALALDGLGPIRLSGTQYQSINAVQSGPLFLGVDEQDHRPQFAWDFIVWRSR